MQFTRLRLSGFKSFVDPTELVIEPGLTGVIGPNGCGKSNLIEALRWVMGETSPKSMRGSGMDDVIFSGTAERPARNLAEVTLIIDNARREAPAAYNDSDMIEISRRIERDSGSSYRINGRDVRARDVQLLFADAASGAHSPSMVSQGRIGALINAKPIDRRAIMEEAAGITGLHSRRHEAELRLRAAEANLGRLEDVTGQLETQLRGLKRQARQATRYHNLTSHIRRAEAISYHLRWSALAEQIDEATARLADKEAEVASLAGEAAAASTRQADAQATLAPLRTEEAEAAAALHRLAVERDRLGEEENRAREAALELRQRVEEIDADRKREERLRAEAAEAADAAETERATLLSAGAEDADRLAETTAALNAARAALGEAETAFDEARQECLARDAARERLEKEMAELRSRLARLADRRAGLEAKRTALASRSITIDDGATSAHVEVAREAARDMREAADKAEIERAEAQNREAESRDRLQAADAALARLAAEEKALSRLLESGESDLWPPLIDAIDVELGYEAALGAALGDDLAAPSDEAAPVHWADPSPGRPHQDPALPEGAAPLTRFVRAPQLLTRRLAQIGVVEPADGPRLRAALRPGQRLVTREGALWRWDGFTAAADAPLPAAQRLEQRNRLNEIRAARRAAEPEADAARAAHDQARQAAIAATEAEQRARRDAREADDRLAEAREARTEALQAESDRRSQLAATMDALDRIAEEITETEAALSNAEAAHAEAGKSGDADDRLAEARARLEGCRRDAADRLAEDDRHRREAALRADRLGQIERETLAWRNRAREAEERIAALAARRLEAESELKRLSELPGALAKRRAEFAEIIEAAERRRREAADRLAEGEARLAEADGAARAAQQALAQHREDRVRAEAAVEQARERAAELAERIREALDCEPDGLIELAEMKPGEAWPEIDAIQTRIERLKRERETMGPVNLRAEAEARELSEQLDGLLAERDDLEAAIARLRRGIAALNREGRERLMAAFNQVNAHFGTLFERLFGGGRAHLALTDSDDPLEAGLEIMASPPGKRLQLMTLLSGGEQALTALALIFAVFLTNPAPVCVLDEVDAPLDDPNVERFCSLVNEIGKTTGTRFLIVTHHPISMSRMSRLFGVTMAERGVSQLVSVDLSRARLLRAAE